MSEPERPQNLVEDEERALARRALDLLTLDDAGKRMRAAVEGMGGDVGELREGIELLEPHLEDVSRVAHPLRRIGAGRRSRADD